MSTVITVKNDKYREATAQAARQVVKAAQEAGHEVREDHTEDWLRWHVDGGLEREEIGYANRNPEQPTRFIYRYWVSGSDAEIFREVCNGSDPINEWIARPPWETPDGCIEVWFKPHRRRERWPNSFKFEYDPKDPYPKPA